MYLSIKNQTWNKLILEINNYRVILKELYYYSSLVFYSYSSRILEISSYRILGELYSSNLQRSKLFPQELRSRVTSQFGKEEDDLRWPSEDPYENREFLPPVLQ